VRWAEWIRPAAADPGRWSRSNAIPEALPVWSPLERSAFRLRHILRF
jgi:hypothetical protein